jgi:hypothetical protein
VDVEWLEGRLLIILLEDGFGILQILPLPLSQKLRGDDVLIQVVKDLLDKGAKILFYLLELERQFLIAVE